MRIQPFGMKTRYTQVYGLALALAALVVSLTIDAEAKWTRTHGFACKTFGGTPVDMSFALFNDSTTQHMVALCAVSDTDYFLKQNMTDLNVHIFDGHSSVSAAALACRSLWYTTGGSCGPQATSYVVRQDTTLQPSRAAWTSATAADFGYLWVLMPRKDGSSRSGFRGYFTAGH